MSNYNELRLTYQGGSQETITLIGDTIESFEYQYRNIVAVEVPECVTNIGVYAFCDNLLSAITLNEGLARIGDQAFQHGVYTAVTIPSTVTEIGTNAFNTSDEQLQDQHTFTITCLATTPPVLDDNEGITFGNPDFLTIYVPAESVELYKSAEYWSNYADKIQAIEPSSGSGCYIGDVLVVSGYIGNSAITYMYIGDTQVFPSSGSPEPPVPVEDPMLRQPLTVEITNAGTAATPLLGLCLSGWTSSAVTSIPTTGSAATYITYTINNGAPQVLALSGAVSNSAVTRGISGVAVGDVIRFYATSGTVGNTWSGTRVANRNALGCEPLIHTHFVHSAGLEANVYGNINSLLVTKDEFDLYAAGDDTVQFNASAYTFEYLFMGRSGFTFGTPTSEKHIVLPEPTNGLQAWGYNTMFANCITLTAAPELPATTLANNCYQGMFNGCTSLTTAPELPATTLVDFCYSSMFWGCTSLTTAPTLPVTTLTASCYRGMFQGCTSLTTAPELPATTLADACYNSMFANCTSLTTAPKLPATTLAESCYSSMFAGCTSLTSAPALPATTLTNSCYQNMFNGCTSLTTAPKLPATTLADACYRGMFSNCTSLTTAPELPVTTLTTSCYSYMFSNCTSLTTAPVLPAANLKSACYTYMFSGCTNLNYIKCLARVPVTSTNLKGWVSGVAHSGTFVKAAGTTWKTGTSGIPTGWDVEEIDA